MIMKKILSIIITITIIIVFIFGGYFVAKTVMTKGAIDYLKDKYGLSESQLEIVDYETGMYHIESTDWIFKPFEIKWYNYKWKFEYADKKIFVNRINGRYYDDYQLDDLQIWMTDWLKSNINENIVGVQFDSSYLIKYQMNFGNKSVITENKIVDFFNTDCIYEDNDYLVDFMLALYVDDSYYNQISEHKNEYILNRVKEKIPNSQFEYIEKVQNDKIEKSEFEYSLWIYCY